MKVAVIGGGASGLTAIKICKEYGFEVVCFEKTSQIGGLWRYKDGDVDGDASVMKSTIINTSKEMMSFSDFPPPKQFSNFMHNTKVMQYLQMYAVKFDLVKHIRLGHQIRSVRRSEDFDQTGQWTVEYENDGVEHVDIFNAIFMCTGHHVEPYSPPFKGLDKFQGKVLHTHSLKTTKQFEDKRVMIVGIGNSGGDAATELARVANMVYLITRRGSWVLFRIDDYGYPTDINISRYYANIIITFPSFVNWIMESRCNRKFDHELYSLRPNHRLWSQHPMVNDDLPNRIAGGTLEIRPNVVEFSENGAVLDDGSKLDSIDAVILATGYSFGFPCLEDGVVPVNENRVRLFRHMYSPLISRPETLIIVGCVQPLGAIFPISEMQCRVACEVLAGNTKLPSIDAMNCEIDATIEEMANRYVDSRRHTIQVDYALYMDQLGSMIGVTPDVKDWRRWFSEPGLMSKLLFGPLYPYQYRLQGPHSWDGAKEAIETAMERIQFPTKSTRPVLVSASKWDQSSVLKVIVGVFLFWIIYSFICWLF